jgi:uncharacterized protein YfaP (DUF2135 family)
MLWRSNACIARLQVFFWLSCGTTQLAASPILLDFETLADDTPITTQFTGAVFSNTTVATAGISLNEFEFPPRSGVNVVFDDGGPITITFSPLPSTRFGGFFTYSTPLTIIAFDALNNPVGAAVSTFSSNLAMSGDIGSTPNEFLEIVAGTGIARVTIAGDLQGESFTLDDMTFEPVPEPGAMSLFFIGCAGLAAMSRRRKTAHPSRSTARAVPLVLITALTASLLFAEPSVGPITVDPPQVPVNTPSQIRVTAAITDPTLIVASPNLQRVHPNGSITVLGSLHDDGINGDAIAGDRVFSTSVGVTESQQGQITLRVSAAFLGKLRRLFSPTFFVVVTGPQAFDITVRGNVSFDTGQPVSGALVSAGLGPNSMVSRSVTANGTTTDAAGNFSLVVRSQMLPVRIVVQVRVPSTPPVETARWELAESTLLDVGRILVPNPQGAEIQISGGSGQSADGSIRVANLPAQVMRLFARSYDPDVTPEAFPGEFAEMGAIPLNSSVFLWAEALGANAAPISQLSQPVTFRARIPRSQWPDLEDINSGTGRIEVPMYFFNETTQLWQQESVGWLEDGQGTVLPEEAEPVIVDRTFNGDIFATFVTDHLSWMNVDYPYIGPWTLSRLDSAKRNNDCLYNALQLAKTIALSGAGRAAYGKVNAAGADLGRELADGQGPELKNSDLVGAAGEYEGDSGGREDEFKIRNTMWNKCGDGASENDKKNTTLYMAVTILHETAHWKDDVKKHATDDGDTDGEEGSQLEKDLFGGIITNETGIKRDGTAVDNATRDGWLNPANWPPPPGIRGLAPISQQQVPSLLQVNIAVSKTTFALGEEIPVQVTYINAGASPIQVMNRTVLEGWPLHFIIVNAVTGARARFLGSELKLDLNDQTDFTTLQPGATLMRTVNLLRDPSGRQHYRVLSGAQMITAVYGSFRGVPETRSNTLAIGVAAGGTIAGAVSNAVTSMPLAAATVRVLQGASVLATATTAANGSYAIPDVAGGTYTVDAVAPGFLRNARQNVPVTPGQTTTVNFALSPLLVQGEMRVVLTWGTSPRDLDSHLWLPMETPYHVAYFRRGVIDGCPFANLDVDDTTAFGPETVTIKERFRQGTYVYAVHNFSGSPALTASQARVQVFDSTGLIATYDVPTTGSGVWWKVFTINGATGGITEINEIGSDPAPYPDTDAGCRTTVTSRR